MVKRTKLMRAAVLMAGGWICIAHAQEGANAAAGTCSAASLRGDYAVVATYGANVARAVGTQTMDGHGHLRGSAVVNQPGGADGARRVSTLRLSGTYTVRSDGTGTMYVGVFLPNGTVAKGTEDFVITKTAVIGGVRVATEIVDEQRQPSSAVDGSVFVTHTYTRRD